MNSDKNAMALYVRVVEAALCEEGWSAERRRAFLDRLEEQFKAPFPPVVRPPQPMAACMASPPMIRNTTPRAA